MIKYVKGKIHYEDLEMGSWLLVKKDVVYMLINPPDQIKEEGRSVGLWLLPMDLFTSHMRHVPARVLGFKT